MCVRLAFIPGKIMLMIVMLVVEMIMGMFERYMGMVVLMMLCQM